MLAQLIQAMYNIVDSFCGKIFRTGADGAFGHLSVAAHHHCAGGGNRCGREYLHGAPVCTENAGTGGRNSGNRHASGAWNLVYICHFSIFCMRPYVLTSANTPEAIESAVIYGQIVCIGSTSGHFWKETGRRSISRGAICTVRWSPGPWGADEYHA